MPGWGGGGGGGGALGMTTLTPHGNGAHIALASGPSGRRGGRGRGGEAA